MTELVRRKDIQVPQAILTALPLYKLKRKEQLCETNLKHYLYLCACGTNVCVHDMRVNIGLPALGNQPPAGFIKPTELLVQSLF